MDNLIPLQCPNCAGHVDSITLTCKSCGLGFKMKPDGTLVRLDVFAHKFIPVGAAVAIPGFYVIDNPEEAMEMTLKKLAEKLAAQLLPLMEYQMQFDIQHNEYVTYGRIRVAEPEFNNHKFEEFKKLQERGLI